MRVTLARLVTPLDWTIIAVYMAGLIGLSVFLGKGQEDAEDYYVGGRNLPWWAVGVSTMATQTGVISFVSIPAFVALKEGGGLGWLQYELAVPLAMIAVMVLLIPFFRRLELISVYEYLERRYDRRVRLFISAVFQVSRGLATGFTVYATAVVIQVCTGLDLPYIILFVGVITIIYDTIGGMKAVVWSDVIQMVVLIGGLFLCIYYAADAAGGVGAVIDEFPQERWTALNMTAGVQGESVPFWAFLLGGFFLYASYYGTDQSQTQRELSAPTLADTKRSLVFNGLARFPLTLGYLALGICLATAITKLPELQEVMRGEDVDLDHLVPYFVVGHLPAGVRAVLVAGMLAAAMSSLDSALNSLSATTMHDFIQRDRPLPADKVLRMSKITTVAWGAVMTGCAFLPPLIGGTVVEGINKVGSLFYGPILAAFIVGVLSRRVTATGVLAGVAAGVLFNLYLWVGQGDVHWMWWNLTGFAVTVAVASVVSFGPAPSARVAERYTLSGAGMWSEERKWLPTYAILVAFFAIIVVTGILLSRIGS